MHPLLVTAKTIKAHTWRGAVVVGCGEVRTIIGGGDDRGVVAARWSWRYGDDGGDDLDGIVGVWWLRQQRAAKVVAAGGRNISPEMGRRRKFREERGENFDG
ncbi:hypothetical protein Tco_1031970 [Tanacetum coccineum]|uniref:Uncharacterized protein n=1 Tax=Tanacetum coccineum TaxID=301880 RepID=A0ABQ5GAQ0_9ASTR